MHDVYRPGAADLASEAPLTKISRLSPSKTGRTKASKNVYPIEAFPMLKITEALNWCGLVLENIIDLGVLIK